KPDAQVVEDRVVEAIDLEVPIGPSEEDIGGAVVGAGGERHLHAARHSYYHVAEPFAQCVPHETASLGPPDVAQRRVEFLGEESGDPVLESLLLLIRIRKVVRIGAHA